MVEEARLVVGILGRVGGAAEVAKAVARKAVVAKAMVAVAVRKGGLSGSSRTASGSRRKCRCGRRPPRSAHTLRPPPFHPCRCTPRASRTLVVAAHTACARTTVHASAPARGGDGRGNRFWFAARWPAAWLGGAACWRRSGKRCVWGQIPATQRNSRATRTDGLPRSTTAGSWLPTK